VLTDTLEKLSYFSIPTTICSVGFGFSNGTAAGVGSGSGGGVVAVDGDLGARRPDCAVAIEIQDKVKIMTKLRERSRQKGEPSDILHSLQILLICGQHCSTRAAQSKSLV